MCSCCSCSCCKKALYVFLCCIVLLGCNAVNVCINVSINCYHKAFTWSLNSDIFVTFGMYFVNGLGLIVLNTINLRIRNKRKFMDWVEVGGKEESMEEQKEGRTEEKKILKVKRKKAGWSEAEKTEWEKVDKVKLESAIKYFKDNENSQFHLFQLGYGDIYFHHMVVTNIRVVSSLADQQNINNGQGTSSNNTKSSNVHEDIQDVIFEYTDYDGHKVGIKDIPIHKHGGDEESSQDSNDRSCKKCCFNFLRGLICLWSCPVAGLVTDGNRKLLSELLHKDLYVRKIRIDIREIITKNVKQSIGDVAYDAAYNNCEHYAHQIIGEPRESKQLTTMGTHASYYVLNSFGPFAKVNTSRKLCSYLLKFFIYFAFVILVSIIVDLSNYNDPEPYYISTLVCSIVFELVHIAFELCLLCCSDIAEKHFRWWSDWFPIIVKLFLSSLIMVVAVNGGAMLGSLIFENLPLFVGEFIMSSFCCITAAIFFSPLATVYVDFFVFTAYKKQNKMFSNKAKSSNIPRETPEGNQEENDKGCKGFTCHMCLLFVLLLAFIVLPLILASFAMLAVVVDGMFFTFDCYGLCPWATTVVIPTVSYVVVAIAFVTNLFAIVSFCRNLGCIASSKDNPLPRPS